MLAKLDDAEQTEKQRLLQDAAHPPVDEQPSKSGTLPWTDTLTDANLEDLPGSQLQFLQQTDETVKRSRLQGRNQSSTPSRTTNTEANTQRRRSMTDHLKRTMLCNAAAPANVSRCVVLKEAVVSEEISVAMQAMETASAESPDLGPFFGLPSKVKDLMYKFRGIKELYGEI